MDNYEKKLLRDYKYEYTRLSNKYIKCKDYLNKILANTDDILICDCGKAKCLWCGPLKNAKEFLRKVNRETP
jgi:hypothetical protein